MGKKYEAYEKAAQAENTSKWEAVIDPTPENLTNARQAELGANLTWNEFIEDPEG